MLKKKENRKTSDNVNTRWQSFKISIFKKSGHIFPLKTFEEIVFYPNSSTFYGRNGFLVKMFKNDKK